MENKRLYTIYIKNWKDPISGIIESSSNYWVLIKRIPNDYILDGFAFIQKCHIESYKRTEEDRFKEKILIAKGLWTYQSQNSLYLIGWIFCII